MKNITFDLNGVLIEKIEARVIRASLKKHGLVKTVVLMLCYKFNRRRDWVDANISDILERAAFELKFLPGAEQLVQYCVEHPDYYVDVCSNMNVVSDTDRLESHLRGLSPYMNRVDEYKMLKPHESKYEFYNEAKFKGYSQNIIVEDSLGKLKNIRGADRMLIKKGKIARKIIQKKYGIACFKNVQAVYDHITRQAGA